MSKGQIWVWFDSPDGTKFFEFVIFKINERCAVDGCYQTVMVSGNKVTTIPLYRVCNKGILAVMGNQYVYHLF